MRGEKLADYSNQKMLGAAAIVKDPSILDQIQGCYQTVLDFSTGVQQNNLDKALKIMADKGWKAISMTSHYDPQLAQTVTYVILERD